MEQRKTAGRGMAVLLSAALVPTVGVPATAFADEREAAQEQAAVSQEAPQRANAVDELLAQDATASTQEEAGQVGDESTCAVIGSTEYASLNDAFAAAADGDTIKLSADADISQSASTPCVKKGINLVLDLNGHKLKAANTETGHIEVLGGLTIADGTDANKNGSGSGVIYTETEYTGGDTGYALVRAADGGSIVMESGRVDAASFTADHADKGQFAIGLNNKNAAASFIMNGGKIVAGWYAVSGNGTNQTYDGNITINGGELASLADYAIYNPQKGTVTINGGVVYGQAGGIALNRGDLVMKGGTVTSKGKGDTGNWGDGTGGLGNAAINVNAKYGDASATITGGTVTAEGDALTLVSGSGNNASISVSGGRFSGPLKEEFCASGYKPIQNQDGMYGVELSEEHRVAEIAGTYYPTINDAIDAAQDGDTVKLLQDVELSDTLSISEAGEVALDIAGNKISVDRSNHFNAFKIIGATKLAVFDSSSDSSGLIELGNEKTAFIVGPGATLDLRDISINLNNPSNKRTTSVVQSQGDLIVGSGASIEAGCIGFTVIGAGSSLVVEDGAKATTYNQVISGNGQQKYAGTDVVVNGGELVSTDAAAIYQPQEGSLVLNGGHLEGKVGVQLCAGSLDVPSASTVEVVSTAPDDRENDSGDGVIYDGAALSVVKRDGYAEVGKASVAGGSFLSNQGEALLSYAWKEGAEVEWPESAEALQVVGGSYSSDPSEFVPDGYDVVQSGDVWTVSKHVPPVTPPSKPDTDVEVEQKPDGSTVTTETKPDGSQTVTTETPDGTSSQVEKDADGNVTSTEVSVSDKAAASGKVELPIDASKPAADAADAPAVEVKVPASVAPDAPVKVTVPVAKDEGADPNQAVVVVAVDAEGNERVLPKCFVDADGNVAFEATGDVTIKVVDASPSFPDVEGEWYGEDGTADFVGARGILQGMPQADGSLLFDGGASTTRAMFVTMLHRLESEMAPAAPEGFDDIDGDWFADAAAWGAAADIVNGYGDGSAFGGNDSVTREQMAVFAMRYAQWLGLDTSARADLSAFADAATVSPFASEAVSWAAAEGILRGHADGSGRIDPAAGATRAEASAVIMRLVGVIYE